jgi:subtilase family serine protease
MFHHGSRPLRWGASAVPSLLMFSALMVNAQAGFQDSGRALSAPYLNSHLASQQASRHTVPSRLTTEPIDPSLLQPLPNHVPLWAKSRNNVGLASLQLALTMVLSRPPEQQAALEKLLADQKNPASPDFHHWLTPSEIGERFGPADADLQEIEGWIQAQGLQLKWVSPSRTFVGFGGQAATVGHAFGTEIHNYRVNGADRISVSSDPMIPVALAPVVKSIFGLYTIEDHPFHALTAPQTANPDLSLPDGSHFIVPADFQTIYDGIVGASGYQQTIGIVGRSRTNFADFTNFKQLTQSSFQTPTEIVPTAFGGVDPGPALTAPPTGTVSIGEQLEATLDVTRAGSVAPNANLLLVVASTASGGIGDDAQYLVQTSPVPVQVMNISYGDCESDAGPSGVKFWDTLFEQAAAEGISVFVSSGDSGASGCEASFTAPSATPPAIGPNYICSSSYATCVGGTEFNDTGNPSAYWGSNGTNLASAQKYIPEGGWNEPADASGNSQAAASGGGVSSVIPTPNWQTGPGVPSARSGRYTPDVSFSSSCHDSYFGCMAAAGGSCVAATNGSFSFVGFCGTSAAAPSMAGVAALLDEKMKFPVGNMNPEIYAMGQNQPSSFHDATPAASGVATCDINTPSMCNNSTPGPTGLTGGQAGYPVTVGYDLVTGEGSPDILNFMDNFPTALPVPTVTVTPSAATITAGQPLTITVTVAGATGQPVATGTVTLTSWGYSAPAITLASGKATFVIPAGSLPGAIDTTTFTVQYIPDPASSAAFSEASGTCSVAVTLINPTLSFSFSPASVTTAQSLTLNVTVSGGSGDPTPTGTVSIDSVVNSGSGYTSSGVLSGGVATIVIPPGVLPPGTDRIDANFGPDTSGGRVYSTAIGSANVTVTQGPKTTPAVTTTLSPSNISVGASASATITVTPASGSLTPTGTVSLAGTGGTLTQSLTGGSALIVVLPGWFAIGNNSVTASYSGDSNFNPATATQTVTVSKATTSMLVTPGLSTITTAQTLPVSVSVLDINFVPVPTGTIMLTSGTYTSPATTVNGSTTVTIPAGALATGTDTLSVAYSGDGNYNAATGTASVTVTTPPPPPPSFTVGATAVAITTPGATTGNTSTITVTPAGGFTGSVTLAATLTSSPPGAQYPPTLSFGTTSPVSVTSAGAATATLTVSTTAPTTGAFRPSARPGIRWYPLGETALAGILLVGFRARRRSWRLFAGSLLLLAAFSSAVLACGGGGSSGSSSPPTPPPGTTAGTYSVAVTATSGSTGATTSVTVVVQ